MSYDVSFRVKVQDLDEYVEVGNCEANITWNVGKLIRKSTGLEWNNEENNGLVKDVIPCIELGLKELITNPEEYRDLEPPNGWGTIEGTINFFNTILEAWKNLKESYDTKNLADVATFWIT